MDSRARAEEIAEIKKRNSIRHGFASYDLQRLKRQFERNREIDNDLSDFYLIRSVTLLEVLTRTEVALIVNHAKEYTDRAVELTRNFKMDLALVQGIQGRVITLGDIVGHSIPVNHFHHIISHFEVLLGEKLRPLLVTAVDRWRTKIEKQPPEPIIADYDRMVARLTRLFEVRHILCHELPSKRVYTSDEVIEFLDQAICFAQALETILTFRKYGLVPLTQTEMNVNAYERLERKTEEMDGLLSQVRNYVDDSDKKYFSLQPEYVNQTWLQCLNDNQEKWVAYMKSQAELMAYEYNGGTIQPTIRAGEATRITEARIADLISWLERKAEHSD
jgi:hypothetical protein